MSCTTTAQCSIVPTSCCAIPTVNGTTGVNGTCSLPALLSSMSSVAGTTYACKLGSVLENSIPSLAVLAVSFFAFA